MNFGDKLQTLRKGKSLSQEQLADQLNVSRQAVSKWETGEGYPELDKLIQISNLFDVSLDYLVKNKEEVEPEKEQAPLILEMPVQEPTIVEPVIEEPIIVETIVEEPVDTNKPDFEEEKIRPVSKGELQFSDIGEVEDYISLRQQFSSRIGFGVMLIIGSIIFPATMEFMEALGAALMFVSVGAGVGLIIIAGINYSHMKKPDFVLSVTDHSYFMAEFEGIRSRFAKKISFGVFLILASIALIVISEEVFNNDALGVSLMFISIGLAVYLFITAGMELDTYKQVTNLETVE
ncbi:MAG: helix-turn-helix transcriptional regulator, partial [Coprobacillus sp.]